MIEVGHDLVARPRRRRWHDYDHCGWHYSDFAVDPAQILYRWSVNRLLIRQGVDLQLAKSGEDVGRLVHATFDGREDLAASAASRSGDDGDEVRHAIALFRAREAGVEHKRSACTTLARVLESRRMGLDPDGQPFTKLETDQHPEPDQLPDTKDADHEAVAELST
jgi:hypothetical protein